MKGKENMKDKEYNSPKRIKGNRYRIDGDTAHILLQNGSECVVDTADFYMLDLAHYTWTLDHGDPKQAYVRTTKELPNGKKRPVLIQHKIMGVADGRYCGMVVDHINGDHLDNRRFNLRLATVKQNNGNRHK